MFFKKDAKDKEGRWVKILGRATGIVYRDKDRKKYYLDSEMLVGESDIAIFSDSVRYYEDTIKSNPIPQNKKEEIVSAIVNLLKSSGIKAEV